MAATETAQDARRHFVFVAGCGCVWGIATQTPRCPTEDKAWDDMYDTRAAERHARSKGVHVVHVDHATYVRDFYELMLKTCDH